MATKKQKTLGAIIGTVLAIAGTVYVLSTGGDGGIFQPDCSKYQPGDTIKLPNCTYAYLNGLKGDSANPIHIDISGAKITKGIDLQDPQGVELFSNGTGVIDQGNADPSMVAISLHGKVNHVNIHDITILNAGYGLWVKNEPRTFADSSLSSWIINDVWIHNVKARHFAQHFLYGGATQVINTSRVAVINGVNYYFNPSKLSNIRVTNNYIRDMGKNGPMLCGALYGKNEIAYNDIDSVGMGQFADQGTGIALGGFTCNVWVHDNTIKHSWQPNIWGFGGKNVVVENNICQYAGNIGSAKQAWPENIRLQVDPQYTDTVSFSLKNNTADTIAVYKMAGLYSTQNAICGNTVSKLFVDTGITYTTTGCALTTPSPITTTQTVVKEVTIQYMSDGSFRIK